MQSRSLVSLAVTLFLACGFCGSSAWAGPAENFADLHQKYLAIDRQLSELMKLYYDPQVPVRDPIVKEYGKLVDKANGLLADLRTEGMAAFKAEPNKDEKVTRVLLGLASNDLRRDLFDEARVLVQFLQDNECTDKALFDLAGQVAYARDEFDDAEKYFTEARTAKTLSAKGKAELEDLPDAKERWAVEQELRQKEADRDLPRVKLETTKGTIVVELFEDEAPQTVGNFVSLVEKKFYDGKTFHRVLPGFMAQGGDPKGDGTGGPGYHIHCECFEPNHRNHFRGTLSMAHAGRDTGGSQFFLTFLRTPQLDGKHTVFGHVIEGLDVLAKLQRRDPDNKLFKLPDPDKIVKATVVRKREHDYQPTKAPEKKVGTKEKEKPGKENESDSEKDKPDKEKKNKEKGGEGDKEKGSDAEKDKPGKEQGEPKKESDKEKGKE